MAYTLGHPSRQFLLGMAALMVAAPWVYGTLPSAETAPSTSPAPTSEPAQTSPASAPSPVLREIPKLDLSRYMFEDQIQPGMKGYGLTVMHGAEIQRFEIEVIDVVKNFSPGNNAILVRCSGLGLEKSGIIAGMSGSPVYINDKMIGAIAYGWDLSKDPIGGVQPIRQMLNIPLVAPTTGETKGASKAGVWGNKPLWTQPGTMTDAAWKNPNWRPLLTHMMPQGLANQHLPEPNGGLPYSPTEINLASGKGLRPLASPLMTSGLSAASLAYLNSTLAPLGLIPVNAGAGVGMGGSGNNEGGVAGSMEGKSIGGAGRLKPDAIKLEPGSALAITLMSGDMDLSGIGTVTEVADGHIWAFGHAMFAEGPNELPISTGYIYTIMPNLSQSFKMGTSFSPAGQLVTDEQTGIVGRFGKGPDLVPVTIAVKSTDGSVNHTYQYQMVMHPRLSVALMNVALNESVMAQRTMPPKFTGHITGEIKFNQGSLKVDTIGTTHTLSLNDFLMATSMLLDNKYQNLKLEKLQLNVAVDPVDRSAQIKSVHLARTVVTPGSDLVAKVVLELYKDKTTELQVKIKVPEETPDGQYTLLIGSAEEALSHEESMYPKRFAPEDIDSLKSALQRLLSYSNHQLYARLTLNSTGASEGRVEMPNLPESRKALYLEAHQRKSAPVYTVVGREIPTDYVITQGGETISITVDKNADKRYYQPNKMGRGFEDGGMFERGYRVRYGGSELNMATEPQP